MERHRQIGREVGGGYKQQRRIHNLLITAITCHFFKIKTFEKNATNIFLSLIFPSKRQLKKKNVVGYLVNPVSFSFTFFFYLRQSLANLAKAVGRCL